jgi:hypothetical protein
MKGNRTARRFLAFLAVFTFINLVSWPLLLGMGVWVFQDNGSSLNLDYLLSQHLRLGVDTYYAYGLLPVSIEHWLFLLCGRGYWPLIALAVATYTLVAWFWALFLCHCPQERIWFLVLLESSCLILWVTPIFAYSLVQLSMLFALLLVLIGRMDFGLAVAGLGAWCVPSMPLVLMALLVAFMFLNWFLQPNRSFQKLIRSFGPGIATYVGLGLLIAVEFGWRSVMATVTPGAGHTFYQVMHYGELDSSFVQFVHPPGHSAFYYIIYSIFSPVSWWVLSVLCLTVFGVLAARRMVVNRALNHMDIAIVLCATVHAVFVLFAYGARPEHTVYDPVLVAGMLLGLSALPKLKTRTILLQLYIVLAILGQANYVRQVFYAWTWVRSPTLTANLYSPADWLPEWAKILDISTRQNLFLLSYGTGIHDYFPTVHSADAWFLNPGQLLPADKDRLMRKLESADVVVYDLRSWSRTGLVDYDLDIQRYLYSLCLTQSTQNFQIWRRKSAEGNGQVCLANGH